MEGTGKITEKKDRIEERNKEKQRKGTANKEIDKRKKSIIYDKKKVITWKKLNEIKKMIFSWH